MSERKAGWYWVKHFVAEWECQYWDGKKWETREPISIGPRILTPDETEDMVIMPRSVYDMICAAGRKRIDQIDRTWGRGEMSRQEDAT